MVRVEDELIAIVGIEGRLVDHGQHFTRGNVEHDDRARTRMSVANGRLQFAVREILNTQVDRQHQIATGPGGPDAVDVLNDVPVAVLDHALGAVLPGKPVVERQLEAFLARIIDVRESQHVPGDFAARVIAPIFARGVHTGNVHRLDLGRIGGLPAACDVHELAVEIARDATSQVLAVQLQCCSEFRYLVGRKG